MPTSHDYDAWVEHVPIMALDFKMIKQVSPYCDEYADLYVKTEDHYQECPVIRMS